jgi:quinol monooxygenase YgiN
MELDELIARTGLPVRGDTLTTAWERTAPAAPSGQVLLLVVMRARPAREAELAAAAEVFVRATMRLEGALGSTLHRSPQDPAALLLVERFEGRPAFERHMGSDYFREFQIQQQGLLAEPVQALFLEPNPGR